MFSQAPQTCLSCLLPYHHGPCPLPPTSVAYLPPGSQPIQPQIWYSSGFHHPQFRPAKTSPAISCRSIPSLTTSSTLPTRLNTPNKSIASYSSPFTSAGASLTTSSSVSSTISAETESASTPTPTVSSSSSAEVTARPFPRRGRGRSADSMSNSSGSSSTRTRCRGGHRGEKRLHPPVEVTFRIDDEHSRLECLVILLLKITRRCKIVSNLVDTICPKKRSRYPYPSKDKPGVGHAVPEWWPTDVVRWNGPHHLHKPETVRLALYLLRMYWSEAQYESYNEVIHETSPSRGTWQSWIERHVHIDSTVDTGEGTTKDRKKEEESVMKLRKVLLAEYRYITKGEGGDTLFTFSRHVTGHMETYVKGDTAIFLAPWEHTPPITSHHPQRIGCPPHSPVSLTAMDTRRSSVASIASTSTSQDTMSDDFDFSQPPVIDLETTVGSNSVSDSTGPATTWNTDSMQLLLTGSDYATPATTYIPEWTESYGLSDQRLINSWFTSTMNYQGNYQDEPRNTQHDSFGP
ncbi:hypothetical protein BDZ85DRAFT_92544 [Elsinoe ampelina]|uniref:Subtelomeric hrmA-associated cluster protein AFUB-079030/YDR124W-like helical bundle domain-containing protein n=1 Tax=Elsinoe ampelina TaxID=302913 RepID=A0A6A6FYE3_9PEZI|nr:hypothetical protein BDZ85DRAFT_92544 [Elsinoe ampelina]